MKTALPVPHSRRSAHWRLALELSTKLMINGLLSAAAITALLKLIPQYKAQQAQLRAIQSEVQAAEARVEPLRKNFQRYFVPHNSQALMEELSPRVNPQRRRIIFLEPNSKSSNSSTEASGE